MKNEFADLTDAQLREKIAEKEALVFLALRVGGVGMWDWHLDPATPYEGGHVKWDAQMHELFGTSAETWGGTFEAFEALLVPEDRGAVSAAVKASLDHAAPYDYSFRLLNGKLIRGKGRVFYNNNDDTPVRMLGVCIEDKGLHCSREDCKYRIPYTAHVPCSVQDCSNTK